MLHSDDELPELSEMLGFAKATNDAICSSKLRRSPRKKTTDTMQPQSTGLDERMSKSQLEEEQRPKAAPQPRTKPSRTTIDNHGNAAKQANLPVSRKQIDPFASAASYKNTSRSQSNAVLVRLPPVDSLLLPLLRPSAEDDLAIPATHRGSKKGKMAVFARASKLVLDEARCNDDEDDSRLEDEEEEDTDLSGFIVDDSVDLSYHEWSDGEIAAEKAMIQPVKSRRRLQRGSPHRRREHPKSSITGDLEDDSLIVELDNLGISKDAGKKGTDIEVIDLTHSPGLIPSLVARTSGASLTAADNVYPLPKKNLLQDFNDALRFSPPTSDSLKNVPKKIGGVTAPFTTPPNTPPQSPPKLKSPSKLLSPSKRDNIPRSPHRQSTDAFWDLHTINRWNDQYSPKKAVKASPRKRHLANFQIWSDDCPDEEVNSDASTSSLPSPCASPTKPRSPLKSPEKAERQRLVQEKREAKARKVAFDAIKESMACNLLAELDQNVTANKISTLSASTGGVKVVWSKNLRSTAGRANWRRTVTKLSGSPIKGNSIPDGPGVRVEHFADIELASKVIDSEDRLVNTLAHEFCHLANFMVSNVRDQPHGTSFKQWASKVTRHLNQSDSEVWRKVEVTTKHSYKIDHKYLWICVGRERSKAAEFLNMEDEEGCGAEYGRHSKSIDTDTQRCGRCKGRLSQVRPKPRQVSPAKKSSRPDKSKVSVKETVVEVLELSG